MSKYYKAEDVISFLNTHCPKDMWEYQISVLPTIEVSEDCISREWIYDALLEYGFTAPDMTVTELIEEAPSVVPTVRKNRQVEREEGEWIELGQNKDKTHNIRCKACGAVFKSRGHAKSFYTKERFRSCPNCGAKMRLE